MNSKTINALNRPLTPHLTIYTSQLTSIYSIWHRISGIALILSLVIFLSFLKSNLYFIYGLACTKYFLLDVLWVNNSLFLNLMIFLSYHMLNGVRHIVWDLGFILPVKIVLNSAKILGFIICCYIVFLTLKIVN